MKKSIRVSKKAYFLAIILALLAISTCLVFSKAIVNEDPFDIIQFKENIQASPDECWKKPAENRKNAICSKLTELQQLITEEQFEESYNKLLHDIKPKLTGLKQDEYEIPWGNGVYKQPWVICSDLQAIYRETCDSILSQINPNILPPPPLDTSPPTISIVYNGDYHAGNPGEWIVDINDPQSGLGEVQIDVYDEDGNIVDSIYDQNLNGIESKSYNIPLLAIVGDYTIVVTATNFDDFSQTKSLVTTVLPDPGDPDPPPIIIG